MFLSIALLAGAFFAKAQTVVMYMQNGSACDVYYQLLGGTCDNMAAPAVQVGLPVKLVRGANTAAPFLSLAWSSGFLPSPPNGFVGVRVYSDDPMGCSSATFTDFMVPSGGPMPLLGGPVFPTCASDCSSINFFFESYCGNPTNYVHFY